MLQVDERVGGEIRYILADEPVCLMNIPDEVLKCVIFLGYRLGDGSVRFAGTALYLSRPIEGTDRSFVYLVTARHVIDYIKDLGLDAALLRIIRNQGMQFGQQRRPQIGIFIRTGNRTMWL